MTLPDPDPTLVGNRYRLEELIGAGAMGAVWRGTDELLNRAVAVKELLAVAETAGGTSVEESRQRILREGRIGARLQHPHVISMFDVVVHDERPWLVMEYLPSRSLSAVLNAEGAMDPRDAAELGRQVADGLAAAHAAGVVHRDVKPGNVLMGDDGRVKLTDFGVSRAVDDVQLTRTGLIAGTPAYLAPEIARGREPAPPSDVFALGATLYAAVEGRPPFGLDENAYALLHKVATGDVDPPSHAGPLTAVLMRLLDRDPERRPTAGQARDLLTEVAEGRLGALAAAGDDGGTRTDLTAPVAAAAVPVAAARPAPRRPAPDRPARAGPQGSASAKPAPARSAGGGSALRRRAPVLLGLLLLLMVGAGVAIATLGGGAGQDDSLAQPTVPAPPATSEAPEPTTEPTPPPTTPPPTSEQPDPVPAAGDPVAFVQNYYGLLPGNTDAAWALLSPAAQSASGGRGSFDSFYGDMNSVNLRDVRQVDEGTVEATVLFDSRTQGTSTEPYRFVVSDGGDGTTIMQSFSSL